MKILLTGPIGSGKSTQGELLAQYLKVPLFQTGQITRELAKENSDLGVRVKAIMEKGELVDDSTIAEVLKKAMEDADTSCGYIVDGFPRSLDQLKLFDPKFDIVFNFKIPDSVVLERLLKRQRIDDTPEAIQRRLKIYYQQTQPLIDYYKKLGVLKEVNAVGFVEDIQKNIQEDLRKNE